MWSIRHGAQLALIVFTLSVLDGARSLAQQPPFFKNSYVLANFGPITRSSDGTQINVPVEIANARASDELYLILADKGKIGAVDDQGARCGFAFYNTSVTGLANGIERKDYATLLSPGSNLIAILSMQCDRAAKGASFTVSFELLVYPGKDDRPVRFVVGAPAVPGQ
jgi:hypothetical protein